MTSLVLNNWTQFHIDNADFKTVYPVLFASTDIIFTNIWENNISNFVPDWSEDALFV